MILFFPPTRGRGACPVLLVTVIFLFMPDDVVADSDNAPRFNCPTYVDEGESLHCVCFAPNPTMSDVTIAWKEHSLTPELKLQAISRRDNGTVYICEMAWRRKLYTANYTLKVAYGPSADTVNIDGPPYFVTDGSRTLSLYCQATLVNPLPIITWQFDPCNHGRVSETCTFTPTRTDDGKSISCRAVNPVSRKLASGSASYILRLKYPPTVMPLIKGHAEGQIRKSGDRLSCTVTGGKPPVSTVTFNCTNPTCKDQQDTVEEFTVSSPLMLKSVKLPENETFCTCSGIWQPEPGLYTKISSVSFALLPNPVNNCYIDSTKDDSPSNPSTGGFLAYVTIAFGALSICLLITVILVSWILLRRVKRMNNLAVQYTVQEAGRAEHQMLLAASISDSITQITNIRTNPFLDSFMTSISEHSPQETATDLAARESIDRIPFLHTPTQATDDVQSLLVLGTGHDHSCSAPDAEGAAETNRKISEMQRFNTDSQQHMSVSSLSPFHRGSENSSEECQSQCEVSESGIASGTEDGSQGSRRHCRSGEARGDSQPSTATPSYDNSCRNSLTVDAQLMDSHPLEAEPVESLD